MQIQSLRIKPVAFYRGQVNPNIGASITMQNGGSWE